MATINIRDIAIDLMTSSKGDTPGEVAHKLVLTDKDGNNMGSWSLDGLSSRLRLHFTGQVVGTGELFEENERARYST